MNAQKLAGSIVTQLSGGQHYELPIYELKCLHLCPIGPHLPCIMHVHLPLLIAGLPPRFLTDFLSEAPTGAVGRVFPIVRDTIATLILSQIRLMGI